MKADERSCQGVSCIRDPNNLNNIQVILTFYNNWYLESRPINHEK